MAIAILAALALAVCLLAALRGLPGWWLRASAALVLAVALLNPSLQTEEREPLSDILLIVVDESASQGLSDRGAQSEAALAGLLSEAEADGLDTRVARVGDDAGDAGTLAMAAMSELLAEVPRDRVAGAVVISDGQVHDAEAAPDLPAPLHLLRTGREGDWDRRLIVSNAPAFAILDEEFTITLRIEDQGDVPPGMGDEADITLAIDGGQPPCLPHPSRPRPGAPGDAAAWRAQRHRVRRARGRGRADRSQQRGHRADQRVCATGCASSSSPASRIPGSGPGATCSRRTPPSIWSISPSCARRASRTGCPSPSCR